MKQRYRQDRLWTVDDLPLFSQTPPQREGAYLDGVWGRMKQAAPSLDELPDDLLMRIQAQTDDDATICFTHAGRPCFAHQGIVYASPF